MDSVALRSMLRLQFKLIAINLKEYLEECLAKEGKESVKRDPQGEDIFLA